MHARLRELLLDLLSKGYIVGFDSEVVSGRIRVYVRSLEDVKTYNLMEEYEGVKIEYVSVGELKALKD